MLLLFDSGITMNLKNKIHCKIKSRQSTTSGTFNILEEMHKDHPYKQMIFKDFINVVYISVAKFNLIVDNNINLGIF